MGELLQKMFAVFENKMCTTNVHISNILHSIPFKDVQMWRHISSMQEMVVKSVNDLNLLLGPRRFDKIN